MSNVLFTRTDDPNSKAIVDGQIIFSTAGDGNIYVDNGTTRIKMGGDAGSSIQESNVLNTVEACVASTNEKNVAGAKALSQLNETFESKVDDSLTITDGSQTGNIRFGIDANGRYGYYKIGADTVTPFRSMADISGVKTDKKAGSSAISLASYITDDDEHIMAVSFNEPTMQVGTHTISNATRVGQISQYTMNYTEEQHTGATGTMTLELYKVTKSTVISYSSEYGTMALIVW